MNMPGSDRMRVALVHDWLTGMRGGEKVLEVLCELYPDAPIFTLVHNEGSVSPVIERHPIRTSFLQRLPAKRTHYRSYLPLMPMAAESLDLSGFDLILSTSHAVVKGVRPDPGALHLCYCHTPMRYVWDQYDEYFGPGRAGPATRTAMALVAPYLRRWDIRTAARVDHFIANSRNVADRIARIYRRSADVLHAPVDCSRFRVETHDDGYDLIVSALVPYKRIELAIEAYRGRSDRLLIVGSGPERVRLEQSAPRNVEFLGWRSDEDLARLYQGCRALIFPGEEDFGIVPLEAMACGKPVVAFARGGALETVVDEGEGRTGVFFREQTVEALLGALERVRAVRFDPSAIRRHAEEFDRSRFTKRFADLIRTRVLAHSAAR